MKSYRSRDSNKITTKHQRRSRSHTTTDLSLNNHHLSDSPNTVHIQLGSPLHHRSHSTNSSPLHLSLSQTDFVMANTKPILATNTNHHHSPPSMEAASSASSTQAPSESATPTITSQSIPYLHTNHHHHTTINHKRHRSKHSNSTSSKHTNTTSSRANSGSSLNREQRLKNIACVYKWNINGNKLEQFKRAKHEKGFESKEFKISNNNHKVIKEIVWKLECYPNGYFDDDLNKCKLYLTSVKLPDNISKILACFSLFCVETQTRYVGTDPFTYNSCQCQWPDDMMSFDKIQSLSFVIFVQYICKKKKKNIWYKIN